MHPLNCGLCRLAQRIVEDELDVGPPHPEDPIFSQHLVVPTFEHLP
jgi:hypothetical protein